jgi:hypothetical protein
MSAEATIFGGNRTDEDINSLRSLGSPMPVAEILMSKT